MRINSLHKSWNFLKILLLNERIRIVKNFRVFEAIVELCNQKLDYIPLAFMLGFFVNMVVDRWKKIFANMGWIEKWVSWHLQIPIESLLFFIDLSLPFFEKMRFRVIISLVPMAAVWISTTSDMKLFLHCSKNSLKMSKISGIFHYFNKLYLSRKLRAAFRCTWNSFVLSMFLSL